MAEDDEFQNKAEELHKNGREKSTYLKSRMEKSSKRIKRKKRKKLPPEDLFDRPEDYFSGRVLKDYTHSKSMMRIQERITKRAVQIMEAEPPALVLDIGCGAGFSSSYMYLTGFDVVGVDLIFGMLAEYDIRELNPVNADMKYLPFRPGVFDYIISISAFQWIINKLKPSERDKILRNLALDLNKLLKPGGKAAIQFYPWTHEIIKEIGPIFADYGRFKGNFIIDNPKGGPKKKLYIYLIKERGNGTVEGEN